MLEKLELLLAVVGGGVILLFVLWVITEGIKSARAGVLHVAYTNMRLSDGTKIVILTRDFKGLQRFERAVRRAKELLPADVPFLMPDSSGSMSNVNDLPTHTTNSLGDSK